MVPVGVDQVNAKQGLGARQLDTPSSRCIQGLWLISA